MSKLLSSLAVGTKVKDTTSLFNGVPVVWLVRRTWTLWCWKNGNDK